MSYLSGHSQILLRQHVESTFTAYKVAAYLGARVAGPGKQVVIVMSAAVAIVAEAIDVERLGAHQLEHQLGMHDVE